MSLNPERAALVSQAYRYVERLDQDTLAVYSNARTIEINANLDQSGALALANEIYDECGASTRTFTLTISDALSFDDFKDAPPRYILIFDDHPAADPSKVYTLVAAKFLVRAQTATITVRA